jgi:deoxyribodipyrimidine photolyase-like uncharacterized protein
LAGGRVIDYRALLRRVYAIKQTLQAARAQVRHDGALLAALLSAHASIEALENVLARRSAQEHATEHIDRRYS